MEIKVELGIILGWGAMFIVASIMTGFALNYRTKTLKAAIKASIEAEERQKEKIANNLHDEIIPILAALSQSSGQHELELANRTLAPEAFLKDRQIIDQATDSIRAIAQDLIPITFLNSGLFPALEQFIYQLDRKSVAVEVDNIFKGKLLFDKTEQINIYRICLEVLNNLNKHSNFKYLRVTILNNEKNLLIRFLHNGKPVTNHEIEKYTATSKGLGLRSLRTRLSLLHAHIDYSGGNKIATVTLTVPLKT